MGAPPLVVAGGTGPERPEDPADLLALTDQAPHAAQVPGHGQGLERRAHCLLAVERQLFGEALHVHGRTVGKVVDEPGDAPLAGGQVREVVSA